MIIIVVILSSQINSDLLSSMTSSLTSGTGSGGESNVLRMGYFPNLNHAQVIIGLANGNFQKALSEDDTKSGEKREVVRIKEYVFSAGPSVIEALFAGQIDIAYVGPIPAINGYLVSNGERIRIISGSASGGAVFVVRNDSGINSINDLGEKRFASPQLGNTQDVALRKYLTQNGYKTVEKGGNVTVVPVKPSDIVTLMLKKEIDGAWVPEPWGARLVAEADGRIFLDERDLWLPDGKFVTTNIIVRSEYLKNNPEIVKKLISAHIDGTIRINNSLKNWQSNASVVSGNENNQTSGDRNEDDDGGVEVLIYAFNDGLKRIAGYTIPENELRDALKRLKFTYDPIRRSLFSMAEDAYDLGLIGRGGNKPDLTNIYDLGLLKQVLKEKNLSTENL
ncbi:MAG: PhnD/SsuA/transferrin family substrate-binding protein [Nitrososphaeraceae archaeon]|nr:PhnD/SsuA/transferrin family substrate-binding protein [Nitrososphaeraceae archaeon]